MGFTKGEEVARLDEDSHRNVGRILSASHPVLNFKHRIKSVPSH